MKTLLCALALMAVSGCAAAAADASPVPPGTPSPAEARTQLQTLRISPPGPLTGYDRSCERDHRCVFGRPWADVDHNGCDQRSDVLARDLREVRRGPGRCRVAAGTP